MKKFLISITIAVENIDVYVSAYSAHSAVRTQLPQHQAHIGLVFAIARYPYAIVAFKVGRHAEISVYKHLTDVEDRACTCGFFYISEPCSHLCKHGLGPSHLLYLAWCGFEIEYGWEIASSHLGMLHKLASLLQTRLSCGEEVVAAHSKAMSTCRLIVFTIVGIEQCGSFGTLDVDKTDGVAHVATYFLATNVAQMVDA